MRYDRKDKTKIIALSLVLLVFWLFIIFEFTSLSKKTKAKMAAHDRAHAAATAGQAGQALDPNAVNPALRLAALVAPVAPPKSDPFRPIIPPRNQSQLSAAPQAKPTNEPPSEAPVLPPMPESGGRGALQLTGIIVGSPSAAVLRLGGDHYVVREGDLLNNQLRVQQITRNSVVLRDSRSTYTLRLGR
jgi:hypothetical protein